MANNQEVQMLYSELINRMKQGVEMHEQLADYYAFLNLPGYQKCHEYQMLCELLTYRKAKDMYLKEYNKLVQSNYNYANMPASMNNMANSGGSGNSGNVVKAMEWAKAHGAVTVAFTGYDGGKLKQIAEYGVHVPVDDMQITEDLHMVLDHCMMKILC